MTAVDWAAFVVSLATIGAAFAGVTRWLVKHYLAELKPNGGSSIKDSISRIQDELVSIKISVARLEGKFEQHIEDAVE